LDNYGNPQGIRILGVLARIAICYFFASVIFYYLKPRLAFFVGLLMLLLYWALCFFVGNPNDPYSITGYFGNKVDKAVLGLAHMYKGEGIPFDPEGIMSTLSAIVEVIFGYLVGDYIQKKSKVPENLTDPGCGKKFRPLSNADRTICCRSGDDDYRLVLGHGFPDQ
jgi:predicted acyltransferase